VDFVTAKELRAESGKVWAKLEAGEDIVITRNGKPFALMVRTEAARMESDLRAIRAERFSDTLRKIQQRSVAQGLDSMTMDEINAEIDLMRKERR
jgi:antitoxin (DNA-binding transcriptional repressor) of toxin-antitoxin stability system